MPEAVRPFTTTVPPSHASRSAVARPIPREAPVISATRPLNRITSPLVEAPGVPGSSARSPVDFRPKG